MPKTADPNVKRLNSILAAAAVTLATGCMTNRHASAPPPDWLEWQSKRHESIAGTNGWITLVSRIWLEEGPNSAGSHPTNRAVLPANRVPGHIGQFIRTGHTVRFEAAPGVTATVRGEPVRSTELESDARGPATRLHVGGLVLTIIDRGEKMGLRARDPDSPARRGFPGLKFFPYDPAWRIAGRFEPFPEPRTLQVDDVTGNKQSMKSPGELVFPVRGVEHRLQAALEPDDERYFVIFRDETAGRSTYGAGRFLYVDPADATGRVVLDFNRAYTPPCGFTPFATCPLPPPQNRLPFAIPAGERKPAGDSHSGASASSR